MTANFETLIVGSNAVQIGDATSGPILLSNMDTANTIYLSYIQGFDITTPSNAGSIAPLGSVSIVPRGTIWAKCAETKTAELQIIPDGDSYTASPVAIAQQILNSGTILVDNPISLASQLTGLGQTWGAGVTAGTSVIDVRTFQSWQFNWAPTTGNLGTSPYTKCVISFFTDAGGANLVWQETWYLPASLAIATGAGNILAWSSIYGHGPMRGAYMSFSFTNTDSVSQSAQYSIGGSSRSVNTSTMRSDNANNSGCVGTDDVIGFYSVASLAAGVTSNELPLNYYNGRAFVRLRATAATVAAYTILFHIKTQPTADFAGFDTEILGFPSVAPGANSPDTLYEIFLPKRPCTFTVQNTGGVAVAVRALIVADGGKP